MSVLAGLATGNDALQVLSRAIMMMLMCYPIGLGAGLICQYVVQGHIQEHEDANPLPEPTEEIAQLMAESNRGGGGSGRRGGGGEGILEV